MQKSWIIVLLLAAALCAGCGATSQTKMVDQYEKMGRAMTQIHDRGVSLCDQKLLSDQDCIRIKKVYNDTRRVYLITGDTMALAVELDGTDWKKIANEHAARLTAEFTALMLQWLRLVTEFGLIREER